MSTHFESTQAIELLKAHHVAMIDHAEETFLKAYDTMVEQRLDIGGHCIAIFDIDDPFTPDEVVEQLRARNRGYAITCATRELIAKKLREYRRPVQETGAVWSPKGRCWLVGAKVERDLPTWAAYENTAPEVLERSGDGELTLVTFVNDTVLVSTVKPVDVRAHREDVNRHNAEILAKGGAAVNRL